MEEEMEHLVVGMGEITEFNEKVNLTFKDRREEITRLNNTDNLLKKVRDIFSNFRNVLVKLSFFCEPAI
jgi:hypothetical protein